jgi:hypothetical protein
MPDRNTDGTCLRELTTVIGGLARTVEDLALLSQATFAQHTRDVRCNYFLSKLKRISKLFL